MPSDALASGSLSRLIHAPSRSKHHPAADAASFDDSEFVLLQFTRAVESGTVTDQIHEALTRHCPPAEIVAAGILIDFYIGLCNYIDAADLPFEDGAFVGWAPEEGTVRELFD